MIAIPSEVVFESILKNQKFTMWVLGIVGLITVLLGTLLAQWFIRPLLRIIDVTRQLHQGMLWDRTHIRRGDELGDMASQIDSTMDKFSDVISQIRDMVGSVSLASNELKSSSHQLSQGSHQQAATLQEIAGSLQSVDSSVGAMPSTRVTLPGWRMKPAAKLRRVVKRFARRSLRCGRSPRRS